MRDALRTAGRHATAASPLCWLRMEPSSPQVADLRVTTWPGRSPNVDEVRLAEVGYHGGGVRWLA